MNTATLKDPSTVTTLAEWRRSAPSPVTKEWMARLDELLDLQIKTATAKVTELGLPDCLKDWVSEYTGTNERGCHLWRGAIRTGGFDNDIFWRKADHQAKEQAISWRNVDRWADCSFRTVMICPQHRLTLTYCEGDITLVHAPSRDHYAAELKDAAQFYAKH
jgi:hypothetical protein